MLETEVRMEIPQGFDRNYDGNSYDLKIVRSVHGLKQSRYNFYQKLSNSLKARQLFPCSTNQCACASKNLILVVHADDALVFSKKKHWIEMFIKSLSEGDEHFELTDEGSIDKHLDVEISNHPDGTHELKQPYLTKRIVDKLNLSAVETQKGPTPVSSPLLHKNLTGK